jgi:hypothetical protein
MKPLSLPLSEQEHVENQLRSGQPIHVTKLGKSDYVIGDTCLTPWGRLVRVVSIQSYNGPEQHPFGSSLNPKQLAILSGQPYSILELEPVRSFKGRMDQVQMTDPSDNSGEIPTDMGNRLPTGGRSDNTRPSMSKISKFQGYRIPPMY